MEGIANTRVSKQEPLSFTMYVTTVATSINNGKGTAVIENLDISKYNKLTWTGLTPGALLGMSFDGNNFSSQNASGSQDISGYDEAHFSIGKVDPAYSWGSWQYVNLYVKITLE